MYQNTSSAYKQYQNNQVNTSTQGKLVLMLYDGAIRFMRCAILSLEEKEIEKSNRFLIKAQKIISELMETLNFNAGSIANNLYNLYDYMYKELVLANIEKDKNKVLAVKEMMESIRNTWVEII